ncbi:MAG: UDP-N-acetylmuramoyl-L-alanine--D-glutamate ligase [Planctomycetota bacterium]
MARRTLVFGLGRFGGGAGAARYLATAGDAVRIADRAGAGSLESSVRALADLDVDWCLEREDEALLDGVDRVIVNPGVADEHPLLAAARARGVPLVQEIDLFLADYPGQVCLVTGTNGKSTTTHLLERALSASRIDCLAGGNIGRSLLDQKPSWRPEQVAVVEISSFQLARLDRNRFPCVRGAVVVRVTRDHLDRHGSLAAYREAKGVAAAAAREFLVHAADDTVAAGFDSSATTRTTYSTQPPQPGQVGILAGCIHSELPAARGHVVDQAALRLLGEFNLENAMAAFAAAAHLGAARESAGLGIATAPNLPFRLHAAARLPEGVTVYDNAVSTDVESTASALGTLGSLEPNTVHWVGGGKSKDGDFARAAAILRPNLRTAFLFGAAAEPLARELSGVPVTVCATLPAALDAARRSARAGEAILFSPGFASFDQYANFRARGEHFLEWLAAARTDPATVGSPQQHV